MRRARPAPEPAMDALTTSADDAADDSDARLEPESLLGERTGMDIPALCGASRAGAKLLRNSRATASGSQIARKRYARDR